MHAATPSFSPVVVRHSSDSIFSLKMLAASPIIVQMSNKLKCRAVANCSVASKLLYANNTLIQEPKRIADTFARWELMIQHGLVSQEEFQVKSYHTNADMKISCDTVLKLLQEAGIKHVSTTGFFGGTGFAQTPEMSVQNLSWVVTKLQIVFDDYPTWGNVVEVETWCNMSGKNGLRINSIARDRKTRKILIRASSCFVIMSRVSRRFCKIPDEIKAELQPCFFDCSPFKYEESAKVQKLNYEISHFVHKGLKPKWTDLDFNLHVNNVKYMDWILESTPDSLLRSHSISSMTLDYRRECGADNMIDSFAAVHALGTDDDGPLIDANVSCHHLLQLDDGTEVLRGRTVWRPKL